MLANSGAGLDRPLGVKIPFGGSARGFSVAGPLSDLWKNVPETGPVSDWRLSDFVWVWGVGVGAEGGGVDFLAGCSSVGPERMLAKDMGSAAREGFCDRAGFG